MKYKLLNIRKINILLAVLIGLFVVFPDIIREFDRNTSFEPENIGQQPLYEQSDPYYFDILEGPGPGPPPNIGINPPDKRKERRDFQVILIDFLFFSCLAWGLLLINNPGRKGSDLPFRIYSSKWRNIIIISITFILCYFGIFLNSLLHIDQIPHFNPFPWYMNGILLFKGLFMFISVVLIGQLLLLLEKQQYITLENERLKTESLQNRFEVLTSQVSPHFFFNALNSLSGLVREKENKKALKYINEISNLFRYILQGKGNELVSLKEELRILDAYRYLLSIKYEGKLNFKIDLDDDTINNMQLPALSIQPLVENIIKHNVISSINPMLIKLYIKKGSLLVLENLYQPKDDQDPVSGTGLTNLNNRYKYLTGKEINNFISDNMFVVELPLIEIK